MDKTKYNRAAKDSSQLQQFIDEVCDGGAGGGKVTDLYLEIEEEPTQEQLEQVYTKKPDVLRLGMAGSEHVIVLHKSLQSESETRLNYFNIQNADGDIQLLKIEYSEEDGYIAEPYEWSLDDMGGGSKLYQHNITVRDDDSNKSFAFQVILSRQQEFNSPTEFLQYFHRDGAPRLPAVGYMLPGIPACIDVDDTMISFMVYLYNNSEKQYTMTYYELYPTGSPAWTFIVDDVREL